MTDVSLGNLKMVVRSPRKVTSAMEDSDGGSNLRPGKAALRAGSAPQGLEAGAPRDLGVYLRAPIAFS